MAESIKYKELVVAIRTEAAMKKSEQRNDLEHSSSHSSRSFHPFSPIDPYQNVVEVIRKAVFNHHYHITYILRRLNYL